MKLFITIVFGFLAVAASANEDIDWSTVLPMMETPGFWDGRLMKPTFINDRAARIVGGEVTLPNAHPYQVGQLARISLINTGLCGGAIIAPRVILTAAHCLDRASNIQVVMGAHNINTATEPTQQRQTVQPVNYRQHPAYNAQTLLNDIATLILPNPAVFNAFVQPSSLPTAAEANMLFVDNLATMSGWGRMGDFASNTATQLRSVQNNVITNEACAVVFGPTTIQPSTLCTSTEGGRGTCSGDSGGPLTTQVNGRLVQIGIVSFVAGSGCQRGLPAGFVRVTSFLDWIAANSR